MVVKNNKAGLRIKRMEEKILERVRLRRTIELSEQGLQAKGISIVEG